MDNENKLFECDKQSRLRFKDFLLKNGYAKEVTLLPNNDYQDIMFLNKNNKEQYVEIKQRASMYSTEENLYLEEKKFRRLLQIGGSYSIIVNFFGEDMSKMIIHTSKQFYDARLESITAGKYSVKDSEKELKDVRCIEARKGTCFIYDESTQNYKRVSYERFIQ